MGLKPILRTTTSFSALTQLVGSSVDEYLSTFVLKYVLKYFLGT